MTPARKLHFAGYVFAALMAVGFAALVLGHVVATGVLVGAAVLTAAVAIGRWGR